MKTNTHFFIVSHSILFRMRNVSFKFAEKFKTHFISNNFYAVYEVKWKNIVEPDGPQMTIWRIHIACWITKATNTLSECVILIAIHCNNGCTNAPQFYVMRTVRFMGEAGCCTFFSSVTTFFRKM